MMASNPSERIWSQAIDDSDYDTANAVSQEVTTTVEHSTQRLDRVTKFLNKVIQLGYEPDLPPGPMSRRISEELS